MPWMESLSQRITSETMTEVNPAQFVNFLAQNIELYDYNALYGLVDQAGKSVPEDIAVQKIAQAIMKVGPAADTGFLPALKAKLVTGQAPSISIEYSGRELTVQVDGRELPPPTFNATLAALGVRAVGIATSGRQRERMQERQTRQDERSGKLDAMGADDLLTEASRVAYILAHTVIERDIPKTKKEKYDTSFHFTITSGQGATLEEVMEVLPPAALQGSVVHGNTIRVTNKAAVAALLDELGLALEIPLIRGRIGEESERIRLSDFSNVAYQDFRRRAIARQISESELKEFWEAGLAGSFFAR